jgi:hypothetical protein
MILNKKTPSKSTEFFICRLKTSLENYYFSSLGAFCALFDCELNLLAFRKIAETITLDCRVMDEHVWAIFASDEAIAFGAVEPFYRSDDTF